MLNRLKKGEITCPDHKPLKASLSVRSILTKQSSQKKIRRFEDKKASDFAGAMIGNNRKKQPSFY